MDNNHLLSDLYFDDKYRFDSTPRKYGLSFKLFMMVQIFVSFFFSHSKNLYLCCEPSLHGYYKNMGFEIVGQECVHKKVKSKMKVENIEIFNMSNFVM